MTIKRLRQFINEQRVDPTNAAILVSYFNELNHRLFNNALPSIPISWKTLPKRILAHAVASTLKTSLAGKTLIPNTLRIYVSPRKFDDIKLKGIIAHEMIHVFLYLQDDFKTNHDGAFEAKRKELERLAGFPIPRDHQADESEFEPSEYKDVGIILMKSENGYSMGLVNASKVDSISKELAANYQSHIKNGFSPKLLQVQLMVGKTFKEKIFKISRNVIANKVYSTVTFYKVTDEDVRNIKVERVLFSVS